MRQYAGASQTQIAIACGMTQGKVSETMKPRGRQVLTLEVFERIADGLDMPDPARMELGLAPRKVSNNPAEPVAKLGNLPTVTTPPVITGLREVLKAHIQADALMGPLFILPAVRNQTSLIERACQTTRGADRIEALSFGSEFIEFCGWLHQDAGDFKGAMYWTDRALEYAMELDDQRVISYILMRKSNIATDDGDPARALALANTALKNADALTPRLRAVILRQRANAHAMLRQRREFEADAEEALVQAAAGIAQEEHDRASYCSPAYVEMEIGAAWTHLGHPVAALPAFEESRARMNGSTQLRDQALCLARLANAYAAADKPSEALTVAQQALTLTRSLGSARVITQLERLRRRITRWSHDPAVSDLSRELDLLTSASQPPV
ncbi:helix-turn-helix domain-containing protein [Thermomonospora cellulosilytica]|uniref:Tetratricopeptide (TPR) repeat protein n=1 Tax=Thermomonospora cellulosilytica TaxID=1411118 RepID=A0A7W3MYZ5_9ACTN|nr:helix-turn-helix domain-containing protein [Thermomonospora cellulosilytica]MBA9004474.1 tetratricopeptide (TPR) repeat protein [Thermomonospora cellulosilytica]